MIVSFKWDNVYVPDESGDEHLFMDVVIDQCHTKEKVRYRVPICVIDMMCKHDSTPQNKTWWTLNLDPKTILT